MYYLLKARQLEFHCRAVAAEGPHACCWRTASVASHGAALLAARGRPPLHVQLPVTASGVNLSERPVYLRTVGPRQPAKITLRLRPAAPATSKQPAAVLGQRLATPPQLLEQPPKRSRLEPQAQPGDAAAQQEQHAGHLIAHSGRPAVMLEMPPSAASSRPSSFKSTPGSSSSSCSTSPSSWLHRLSVGVSRLLTPSSTAAAAS